MQSFAEKSKTITLTAAIDDYGKVYADGKVAFNIRDSSNRCKPFVFTVPSNSRIIAVEVHNDKYFNTFLLGFGYTGFILQSHDESLLSDETWKCRLSSLKNWTHYNFDDTSWESSSCYSWNGDTYWKGVSAAFGFSFRSVKACWVGHFIPSVLSPASENLFCRKVIR